MKALFGKTSSPTTFKRTRRKFDTDRNIQTTNNKLKRTVNQIRVHIVNGPGGNRQKVFPNNDVKAKPKKLISERNG